MSLHVYDYINNKNIVFDNTQDLIAYKFQRASHADFWYQNKLTLIWTENCIHRFFDYHTRIFICALVEYQRVSWILGFWVYWHMLINGKGLYYKIKKKMGLVGPPVGSNLW